MVGTTSGTEEGAAAHPPEATAGDAAPKTVRVARECIDALNRGDRHRLLATLAPRAVWHSAAMGETITSNEEIARNLLGHRGTFPDLHEEIVLGLIWLTSYGLFVAGMRDFFRSPRIRRSMERVTGAVLVALAGRLALERFGRMAPTTLIVTISLTSIAEGS